MTEALDQILLEWLEATPSIPRRERQALLLKELMAVHTMRKLSQAAQTDNTSLENHQDSAQPHPSLADRETKLCDALRTTMLEVVDVAAARRVAEALAVSTDLDMLYGVLDAHCIMTLRLMGDGVRQPAQHFRGVDDIINELSEFQESVLMLRVDSSPSPLRTHGSHGGNVAATTAASAIAVRGVSPVQSWVAQCAVELEIGTQVTYYAKRDCTSPLFDLRSSFLFSADGAKVERIARELLPRGGHHIDDLLRVLHFGADRL